MIHEDFSDIAPFDDSQFQHYMSELVQEPGFEHAVRFAIPDVDYPTFVKGLTSITSKDTFQQKVMAPFLEMLASKTTAGISVTGLEYYDHSQAYTFITNHRDIVLDASFLNLCFLRHNLPTSEVAIGNNLLIYPWIDKLVRLNKSFIVKRGLKITQALEAAKQLSAYIHYAINQKHQSVWIAQREGRAKDSNDVTQESLIKMLGLAGDGSYLDNVKAISLMPVSISYEYDPNDYLKAREFLLKRNNPDFKKSQRDDLFSMETGLLQFKGRIHFALQPCINTELAKLPDDIDRHEALQTICSVIDSSIHAGYKIYPINYIAYDELRECHEFAEHYTEAEVTEFNSYIEAQLDKVEVDNITADDRAYMRNMMLTMYSNPLRNQLHR
jgi:hypothetical protein